MTMALARSTPWKTAAHSGELGANSPTTSPAPTPRSASAAAILSTITASSPNVIDRPLAPSMNAGASARSPKSPKRNAVSDTSGISTSG